MSEQLKKQFTERIIELQKRIDAIHKDVASEKSADWSELAGERENDEVLNALESEAKVEIQHLSAAIRHIDNGHYGLCAECGEEIAEKRLAIQPAALTCIGCAQ